MRRAPLVPALPALALLAALPWPGDAFAQAKPPPLNDPRAAIPGDPSGKPPPLEAGPRPSPPPGQRPGPSAQAAPGGKPPPLPPGAGGDSQGREVGSGTGFLIGARQALTNNHVVRQCRSLRARNAQGREIDVTVKATDAEKDLALLELRQDAGPALAFRQAPQVRRGETVVTYGFPLAGVLSSGPTLTTGDISALAGLADNPGQYQISAPVQPGNSGGPLLDSAGNVVGVIVSKLNAQRIAQRTGDIPQNVNFAVKGDAALDFLRQNNVRPRLADSSGPPRSAAEVGELVHPSVLFLRCLR
ncbi:serine protease [Roseomonas sp. OT10]|uniref:S1C family serine protease n=1 Tax=Roseomonas cutis TaxID=2897332 RepID=UPI001E3ADCDA|nr:serine protease [Roseomonas sp. OT10]UFN50754.1 serine protease [Roseomonas sp. OT10]